MWREPGWGGGKKNTKRTLLRRPNRKRSFYGKGYLSLLNISTRGTRKKLIGSDPSGSIEDPTLFIGGGKEFIQTGEMVKAAIIELMRK